MRKIKFRLWDKVNEKIVQHDSLKDFIITIFGDVCYINGNGDYIATDEDGFVADKYEIMQFTGLCDDDGKEIYDGDILTGEESECDEGYTTTINCICVVKWDNENGRWIAVDYPSGEEYLLFDYSLAQAVAGNIYEDYHLIEHESCIHDDKNDVEIF